MKKKLTAAIAIVTITATAPMLKTAREREKKFLSMSGRILS